MDRPGVSDDRLWLEVALLRLLVPPVARSLAGSPARASGAGAGPLAAWPGCLGFWAAATIALAAAVLLVVAFASGGRCRRLLAVATALGAVAASWGLAWPR